MSEDSQDDARQNENGTNNLNLAKEVHWLQHATFYSQIGLGVIGLIALWIYHGQLTAMQGQLTQMSTQSAEIQKQTTLSRDIVRGTSAAYIALSFNTPPNELPNSPAMLFINQGTFRAENFSGVVELQCEDLLSRKIISSNRFSFGGPGVTLTKEGGFTFIPIPPKGCDTKIVFAQAIRGLVRKVKFTYLNGINEESSGGFCDEYVEMKYLTDPIVEPDAVFRTNAGWRSCADIPAIIHGAMIPFDTTKKWESPNYRKQHPESQ